MKLVPTREVFSHVSVGLMAIRQTSAGIKSAFKDRIKDKNRQIKAAKLDAKRLLDSQKKDAKEKLLEAARPVKDISKIPVVAKTVDFWKQIMQSIGSFIMAWFVDKIPEIIKGIEKFAEDVKAAVTQAVNIFTGLFESLGELKDVVTEAWSQVKDLKFDPAKLQKEFSEFANSIDRLSLQWGDGLQEIENLLYNYAGQRTTEQIDAQTSRPGEVRHGQGLGTNQGGTSSLWQGTSANEQSGVKTREVDYTKGWNINKGIGTTRGKETKVNVLGQKDYMQKGDPLTMYKRKDGSGYGGWNWTLAPEQHQFNILMDKNGNVRVKYKSMLGTFGTPTVLSIEGGVVKWYDKNFPWYSDGLNDAEKEEWLKIIKKSIDAHTSGGVQLDSSSTTKDDLNKGNGISSRSVFNIADSRVLGYTGGVDGHPGSGSSTGAHLHIEAGGGVGTWLGEPRYESAKEIFPDVLVGGRPLSSFTSNSPPGKRTHPVTGEKGKYHRGYDFAIAAGEPITLREGSDLEFVDYDPGIIDPNGFGYNIVIRHKKTGETYILAHLSAGPEPVTKDTKLSSASLGVPDITGDTEGEVITVPFPINNQTVASSKRGGSGTFTGSNSSSSGDVLKIFKSINSNFT
tara:strand:- start:7891 stop:9762 length:1872 start_codon:yes stop_codon:yes gene_type:complete